MQRIFSRLACRDETTWNQGRSTCSLRTYLPALNSFVSPSLSEPLSLSCGPHACIFGGGPGSLPQGRTRRAGRRPRAPGPHWQPSRRHRVEAVAAMEAPALPDLWAGYPVRREEVLEGYGSGMICCRPVERGEVLLRLDLSVCWTAETAQRSSGALAELGDLAAELSEATQTLGKASRKAVRLCEYSTIALHLLVVSNGAAAERFRHEHVKTMCATTTETLSDEELEALAGSKWQMVAHEMREDIIAEHAELEEVIGDFLQTHGITQEKFLWAHKILLSRAMTFYREGGSRLMVLGPGQDMFNHSCEAVGYEDVKLETVEGKDMLVIRAFKPFAEGEQAFYSYSPASNGRLLLMGGFVVPGNPFDSVELMLTFPVNPSSAPLFLQLAEGLRSAPLADGAAVAEEGVG
eukprot:s415_g22.t1